jgi:transaldolase
LRYSADTPVAFGWNCLIILKIPLDDYRDHGRLKDRIEEEVVKARWMLEQLPKLGISIDAVTQQLEDEGVEKFSRSFDKLMEALEIKAQK